MGAPGGVTPGGTGGGARGESAAPYVVLTGNPNCGKTTLFNALTGLRAKVGNYAGVTVERKEGRLLETPPGTVVKILDLPGTYSLSPQSLDEQISRDVLLHRLPELPAPALVVVVVDASNLQRNLYYATQVIELGYPTLVALNMVDVAAANGHHVDTDSLAAALGVAVFPVVASRAEGLPALRRALLDAVAAPAVARPEPRSFTALPPLFQTAAAELATLLAITFREAPARAAAEAQLILGNENAVASSGAHYPPPVQAAVTAARARLDAAGVDWRTAPIEARYAAVMAIQDAVATAGDPLHETFSDRLDRVLTHKVWGTLIFVAIMAGMFQSIFSFAQLPMDAIKGAMGWVGEGIGRALPPGELNSLLVHGAVAGVGAVVQFLPQILLLFFFIGLLEDTGYMARAAFLMDRLMSKVGLHGKSFIPMLSSFACAIPGIMATRTIESPKDRLVTILVAPLMSCSARLPVYAVLIGACIPHRRVLGFLGLDTLTMLVMYLLGIVVALLMAWIFKRTLLRGEPPMLIMELPPYKRPLARIVLRHMWDRSKLFLQRAGTVILGINILLWFLATYPHNHAATERYTAAHAALAAQMPAAVAGLNAATNPVVLRVTEQLRSLEQEESGRRLRESFAGRLGRLIEPVIAPLGFDWKMGIGIVSSFAAREVFVSTMATVYDLGEARDSEEVRPKLEVLLAGEKRADGSLIYTPLLGITLMIFYVFALQCVSTVAVVRRETNGWKWPLFQWFYMGALAWTLAFITYQGGRLLGWR